MRLYNHIPICLFIGIWRGLFFFGLCLPDSNNNAHEIGAIRETDNNNETIGSEEGLQQTTKSLPAVSDKKGASTYALLQARYAKYYPDFWKKVRKVYTYCNLNDEQKNFERISEFLLSDKENDIFALMDEVKGKTKEIDLIRTFIKYTVK